MTISRRQFLELFRNSAAALGVGAVNLSVLEKALAQPGGPTVIWLQGSACTGCSVSLLNRISSTSPSTTADVLINIINLRYHPNLMAAAGKSAAAIAEEIAGGSGHILAVEGGVPTAFGGAACWAWTRADGTDVTFQQAVTMLAANAAQILCIGTCAAWGGIPAALPNPTGVRSVREVTGRPTLNIAGCPTHPDWIVWAIGQLVSGAPISVDSYGRPAALFGKTVHELCPRREREEASTYGQDYLCLEELGCKGPSTKGNCPITLWNGGANWCCDSNTLCIGCTDPAFPFTNLRSKTYAIDD